MSASVQVLGVCMRKEEKEKGRMGAREKREKREKERKKSRIEWVNTRFADYQIRNLAQQISGE